MPSGKEIVAAAWADAIRPDREISIVDWIESNVVLEEAETSAPGQYRFRRAPYMREILETLSPDCPCQYVTTIKGSQLGMTIGAGAYICFLIAESPCTIIMVSPTLDLAKRASRRKVGPLIVKTDAVRERVRDFGARRAGNTALMKEFPGGVLLFAGGNSGAGLRQLSARVLILDELDVFPAFVPNEGDPEILAERAVKTFSRRKVFKISTPTITGRSRIAQNYEQSDRSRFFVPCPFCGEFQVLWFTDPKTGRKCLRWEGDAPNLTVWYECVKCEARIVEGKKPWMLENGIWRAEHPELSNYHRGFAISSLYAAAGTFSWLKIANQFLEAGKDQMKLCAFVNQVLGETWEEHGDSPPWEELYRRREDYPIGEVPRRGLVLTAGADVQRDRIEVEIVAWGRGRESWSIDYVVIPGDTAMPAPWSKLAELLDRPWKHADGRDLRITGLGVDSSYDGNSVYNWCRRWPADRVFAMRGESHLSTLVGAPSYVDYTWRGKKAYRAVRLWHIGVDVAKRELYGWLRIPAPLNPDTEAYDAGFCHFPKYRERHFEGLTAEHLSAVAKKGGRVGYVWNVHFARNEPLDCFDHETEVLTAEGWRAIRDVHERARVATVNLASGKIEYQEPTGRIARNYVGPMVELKGRRLDVLVTPNHRMVTFEKRFDRSLGKWRFDDPATITLARDLTIHHQLMVAADWDGDDSEFREVPAAWSGQRRLVTAAAKVDAGDWAEFLGWFVADGVATTNVSKTQGNRRYRVQLDQKEGPKADRIRALIARLPWRFHEFAHGTMRRWTATSLQLFESTTRDCGHGAFNVRAPEWVKAASPRIIRRFLEGAILGDGWSQPTAIAGSSRTYATVSRRLADDVQELFLKIGSAANLRVRNPGPWSIGGRTGVSAPQFHVHECVAKKASLDSSVGGRRHFLGRQVAYDGMIYCLTVPNGTLVLRRRGLSFIAGNCRVYARAAAAIVGVDRYSDDDWKRLELELQSGLKKSEAVEVREVRQSPTRRPKRGGFFQRWPSRKPS